jgi:succinate-semialdehyde dehydrogenase / glutarate-semialdehyde dehydrogenase
VEPTGKLRLNEEGPALGSTFAVSNPATGESLASLPDAGAEETRIAIDAAARAFPDWSRTPPRERCAGLERTAELMLARRDAIARLVALEEGKPITEARSEVEYAAGFLTFYAREGERVAGEALPLDAPGKRVSLVRGAVGVAGLITIWNFPAAGVTRPTGAALAAGCTVVVKPAEQTPLTAVAIFDLLEQAGLPPGVANLVTTSRPEPVGRALVESPLVRKLNFTGSTDVGRQILRSAADQIKRVTLELGGHAPFMVLDDADLSAAVEGAVRSKFRNSGQTCVCLNRIYVHEDVVEGFTERFTERVSALRVGNPLDEETDVGPLIDAAALHKVERHVEDAVAKGARVLAGGGQVSVQGCDRGLFFQPTVLGEATADMLVMREETFGPVAPIAAYSDEDELLAAANELPSGLAAFLYTRDAARAMRIADRLDYGVVGINDPLPAAPNLPFGGLKQSGIGKEGGRLGIEEFLDTKLVSALSP